MEDSGDQLFEACGKYARTIDVFKATRDCYQCREKKECLVFDSSDGEYSEIIFCIQCLNKFGDGLVSNSTYNTNDLSDKS